MLAFVWARLTLRAFSLPPLALLITILRAGMRASPYRLLPLCAHFVKTNKSMPSYFPGIKKPRKRFAEIFPLLFLYLDTRDIGYKANKDRLFSIFSILDLITLGARAPSRSIYRDIRGKRQGGKVKKD